MGRPNRTRISRPLIAVLALTIGVGAAVYARNMRAAGRAARTGDVALKAVEPAVLDVKSRAAAPPALQRVVLLAEATAAPAVPASSTVRGASSPSTRPAEAPVNIAPLPPAAPLSTQPLVDSRAKIDANDLVTARAILSEALSAGRLSAADAEAARKLAVDVNKTLVFSKKRFEHDPFMSLYQVQGGDRLARIADRHVVTWELLCRINELKDPKKIRAGQWLKVPNGPFHCVISKSAYRLDVYLGSPGEAGSAFVTTLPVGLGKDNSTPTGTWMVQQGNKAHPATYYSPRGEGVVAADDPKNPLGGYWMGLTGISGNAVEKNSYGIHGTIEPDSIGKQASMGCIRLGHDDIALLYDLLVDGKSKVIVKD